MKNLYIPITHTADFAVSLILNGASPSDPIRMAAATEAFAFGEWNLDEDFTAGGRRVHACDAPFSLQKPDYEEDF